MSEAEESEQPKEVAEKPRREGPGYQPQLFATFVQQNQQTLNVHQGLNMPPVDEAQRYEAIHPGFMKNWLTMAGTQMRHRHALEKQLAQADIQDARDKRNNLHNERMSVLGNEDRRHGRGMAAAVMVVLLFTLAAIISAFLGKLTAAGLLGAGPIVIIVTNIIRSTRRTTSPDPREKRGGDNSSGASGEPPKE